MKFKKFVFTMLVLILAVGLVLFIMSTCNKKESDINNNVQSNVIVLSLSDAETVEENGATYLDRVARPSISGTDYLPEFGFSFNAKWAEETDKNLEDYFVITNDNGFTCTLRVKQKFEEDILFEIITQSEGYYGAFIITYEGAPTAIEGLPSEVQLKAGTTQEFDLSSFNPLNPDASEEFNDFSVEVKYYGSVKFKEEIILEAGNPLIDQYGSSFEGEERIYSDLSKIPGISGEGYLVTAQVKDGVLILSQEKTFSNWVSGYELYEKDEHKFGPCLIYIDYVECLTAPYAEVTITEKTSGYVQKIKVWMDV